MNFFLYYTYAYPHWEKIIERSKHTFQDFILPHKWDPLYIYVFSLVSLYLMFISKTSQKKFANLPWDWTRYETQREKIS